MRLGIGLMLASTRVSSVPAPFDLATLVRYGWWRASYAAAPWAGTASAGISGSHNMAAGTAPSVGSAVDTFTPAVFNGTTQFLTPAATAETFIASTSSYQVEFVVKPTSSPADPGAIYNCPGILCETGGNWGIVRRVNEVVVYHASTEVAAATLPVNVWSHVVVRFGLVAGELDIFINGVLADHNTGVAATGSVTSAGLRLGRNFGTAYFTGEILDAAFDVPLSDVQIGLNYAAHQARYPSAALP